VAVPPGGLDGGRFPVYLRLVVRRLLALLAAAATAGLFCAAHLSHAERDACLTGSAVLSASALTDPVACLGAAPRI
jgi:hypothetical protein